MLGLAWPATLIHLAKMIFHEMDLVLFLPFTAIFTGTEHTEPTATRWGGF